jgi:hypothetical protein
MILWYEKNGRVSCVIQTFFSLVNDFLFSWHMVRGFENTFVFRFSVLLCFGTS